MEPSDILPVLSSENNKPIGLQGIKRFVSTFYKYLYLTESFPKAVCKFDNNDTSTTPTPQSDSIESPYNALCESLRENSPCLHEPIRELYLYIFGMLQKGLKVDNLSLTEEENNDLADALEALIFIAVSVKTATKLYTCDRHQGQLMGTIDWPAPLIRKLIPYLVQHMDSTTRIDRVLLRALEIIVNPPQPFGTSKAWLTIMREIEEDFILEDSQASKFLSFLFVMLNTEARVRLCGIYQEQVQQLLDADTLPTLSLETLAFINFMSCNTKTQQAWIKSGVHTVLVEWMIECFMANKDLSEDNGREKIDIVKQIFVNLAQGLGKTASDEVVTLIQNRAVAHYKIYQKNDIFKEVMAPILSAVPFSSFVPVSVNIGAHLIGNSEIKSTYEAASLFEESRVSIFDTKQNQDFKDLIQKNHLKLDPCDKFHIEWTKLDKEFTEADFSECIKTADSFLITCVHIPFGRIAKIGVYIGAGFSFQKGFFVANISQENFLFVCLNDGEVHKLDIEFEMKMVPSVNPFGFDIKDLKTNKVVLTCEKSSNIFVCNSLLRRANQEYAKVGLKGDTQFSRDCVNFWMGNTSIDLHKNRNSDCIYGSNHIATNLRNSFQLLRPDNNIFFVPKDLTLREFLEISIPKTEEILDALLVYHEQHIITLETKFVDLKPSSESQSLFQIQDLRLNSLDHLKQLRNFELVSPVQVYKSIISQHYSKLRTPILSHLVIEGEPLAVLKKIAPAGELSKEFMTAYQAILEKIGPYGHILGPIMGKDITLILFEIMLFVRCEEKNFTPRILQKTILQYIQNAQLQACDPNQLYAFLESAIDDVLHKNAVPEKNNLRFVNKYRQVLQQLRESDLIQDNYLVGSLLSTLFKGESAFYSKSQIIQNNLSKPLQYCSEIEELLTEGFDIIIPYCTYQVCNRNFTRLAQSVTAFMKLKAYPAALSKSRFFLETLSDLIMQFRKQNGALELEVFTDSTIEELMLKLIHFVFTTLSQVLQAKQYLSSEIDLPEVLRQTLSVFNLLQDHLKLAHERKNILPSQAEMLVETVESAMTILQMLALEKAVVVRGLEEMYKFWQQYLSKMETVYTPQTVVDVLSLLDSISDDSLFFQILAPILELLEVWSKNSVLVTIFETIVQNPKLDDSVKTLTFFEYIMTFSKKLESANQIAQLIAKNSEIDKEELKANKKAVIVRVCTLFKSIQENLSNK